MFLLNQTLSKTRLLFNFIRGSKSHEIKCIHHSLTHLKKLSGNGELNRNKNKVERKKNHSLGFNTEIFTAINATPMSKGSVIILQNSAYNFGSLSE